MEKKLSEQKKKRVDEETGVNNSTDPKDKDEIDDGRVGDILSIEHERRNNRW